jgi:uncharacterized PurR-regulated membrane protein YhhQ (DUF165 family)
MLLGLALAVYASAIIGANLLVATFGPAITPINAFVLIGLDLALRDWLHLRLSPWRMALLILATGGVSYLLNPTAGAIAVASATSFIIAALADWWVFAKLQGSWQRRANISNVCGAGVDSLLFPTLAFGVLMPEIVLAQFVAKTLGGALWTWGLHHVGERN